MVAIVVTMAVWLASLDPCIPALLTGACGGRETASGRCPMTESVRGRPGYGRWSPSLCQGLASPWLLPVTEWRGDAKADPFLGDMDFVTCLGQKVSPMTLQGVLRSCTQASLPLSLTGVKLALWPGGSRRLPDSLFLSRSP